MLGVPAVGARAEVARVDYGVHDNLAIELTVHDPLTGRGRLWAPAGVQYRTHQRTLRAAPQMHRPKMNASLRDMKAPRIASSSPWKVSTTSPG